jgi:exoribonuclease R
MVHRQLEAILLGGEHDHMSHTLSEVRLTATFIAGDAKFNLDPEAVTAVAHQCNIKKEAAKLAQEQSLHLFLCVLISELTQKYGPVIRPAKVVGVLDEAFDVFVPDFGIEKRVHIDAMPIEVRGVTVDCWFGVGLTFLHRTTSTMSTRTRSRCTGRRASTLSSGSPNVVATLTCST